ncbi:hypothetical protein QJQ45_007090 [Haematococcus lacustris]|nr:hypothetical protein QJQ45_007090 [Haematococcus lacustris]
MPCTLRWCFVLVVLAGLRLSSGDTPDSTSVSVAASTDDDHCFAESAAFVSSVPLRVLVITGLESLQLLSQQYTAATGIPVIVQSVSYFSLSSAIRKQASAQATGSDSSARGYDAVMFSSLMMGDIASSGALVDLAPYITNDTNQVMGVPYGQSVLMMYVNWPLLSSAYNISRPSLTEFGRLSFYPDTWQELVAVMRQVNATANNPVTGTPRHALCISLGSDSAYLFIAVLASIMQTGGTSQGWLYDPLTLEPLTNNTAMLKALEIMWELSPFLRSSDRSSIVDMSQCAIALAPANLFKSLHPLYSNAQFMGQLTMSPLPASTEVLDRSTMQLVSCTAQLCNSQRATELGGQLVNLAPAPYQFAYILLGMSSLVPAKLRKAVYNLIAYIGLLAYKFPESQSTPGNSSWGPRGYNYKDVVGYSTALDQVLKLPTVAADFRVAAASQLSYDSPTESDVLQVPRSAGSPADFAAAMTSMTSGLRAVRDSLGAAAFREQLWGTTGFVPPTQPPPPTPPSPSPPLAGGPALSTPLLATVIAVSVGVCSLLMVLLVVIITHLRRNAKLQRSLLGHVLPPAAGDKATLVITDVQGSSKLWETLPAGVMEASMKVHDEVVRRLALDSSGYEWATEGDSFLLCFHTPQAAVAFATQLQDALLQCSRWQAELMAAGSPSQRLYLTPLGLSLQTNTSPGSFSDAGTSVTTIPAYSASLIPCLPPSKTQAVVPEPPALFSGPSELSLTFMAKTAPVIEAAGPPSHSGTQQKIPVFVPMTAEPLPQGLPPAALPGMSAKALLAAKTPAKRATKLSFSISDQPDDDPAPRLKPDTLSLAPVAHCPEPRPSLSLLGKESTFLSRPDAPSLGQGSVGWQRLCDLYREVEVEEPGALTVLAGLRVRVGMHTGLAADEVLLQSRMGASSTTYGGAALVLAKAVQLPVEELRTAGISVVHMGKHLVELGEGKGDTALDLYCATLDTPAHAHRLWALGPLRTARQLQPGVLHAPYGMAATAFMSIARMGQLKAWDASLAKECLALYQATAQRVLLHVAGRQLPAGYLVSSADEDGMVLAAFSSSLQCLHWALLTLTTCMDLDWPQALLDSDSGEEVVAQQQAAAADSSAAAGLSAAPAGLAGYKTVSPSHSVRLLRGLRLKAGVDVGEVACDLTPANGRFNYRGRCLNRAARINGLAASGQLRSVGKSAAGTGHTPAPEPATLTADGRSHRLSKGLDAASSVAMQWQKVQQQLHQRSHSGSGTADEGIDRSSPILRSQGQPLALPELLQPLVVRSLGKKELRGIPGQVALVQVSLAAHTSRGQLEAANRLGLMAPGLQLD